MVRFDNLYNNNLNKIVIIVRSKLEIDTTFSLKQQ